MDTGLPYYPLKCVICLALWYNSCLSAIQILCIGGSGIVRTVTVAVIGLVLCNAVVGLSGLALVNLCGW